jgi:hypothetical protein
VVLVGQQHQLAPADARVAAGVVQQHQRQQAVDLRLVCHQLGERAPECRRLRRQLAPPAVGQSAGDGERRAAAADQALSVTSPLKKSVSSRWSWQISM